MGLNTLHRFLSVVLLTLCFSFSAQALASESTDISEFINRIVNEEPIVECKTLNHDGQSAFACLGASDRLFVLSQSQAKAGVLICPRLSTNTSLGHQSPDCAFAWRDFPGANPRPNSIPNPS
jgi:hypothetical protein